MADNFLPATGQGVAADEDWEEGEDRGEYSLGEPAKDAYEALSTYRESVNWMARRMAELTIPSVFPPQGYRAGDDLPGNNHSLGAQCVNTLASKLLFMAFPPGQPIAKLEPVVASMQEAIDQDPELYAKTLLALSQLELMHRNRFASTPLQATYVGYLKLLLIAGNALWKHIRLGSPTFHRSDCYVVSRDRNGHPLVTIHHEKVRVTTLPKDVQEAIYEDRPELLDVKPEWSREADIYSVCKLKTGEADDDGDEDRSWLYWQETCKGKLIPGTEVETDYDDAPMWPGWLIANYGDNWGRSYCEEYRGDLFSAEVMASALNDGTALASWALTFVKPGSRTSVRQVQKARNLDILSGAAEDVTVFRSDKTADFNFVVNREATVGRRLGAAFLLDSATRREGERVTAEEVARVGRELDQAMGGLYTQIGHGDQRRIIMRAIRLHEEENRKVPALPKGVVDVNVVTGVDAMGQSTEVNNLTGFVKVLAETFGNEATASLLKAGNFASRLAAAMSVKPDGLVPSQQELDQAKAQAQQQGMAQELMGKAAGPVAGALAARMADGGQSPPTEAGQ
ncbi:portal protein [Methylobacterium ajmalii]|uniref:portal protein n=1 Tax=Methylobacterium ajmalii TaxID=2738439 RepID=UPI00190998A0|nr:portal protein [Methylobacterium ajmalii]MBK3400430.1 hypothetical protein [Methylobacterium ajmalii]MBK3407528.1 hypothetical protein [Methylobacterium ajmalii]MBK3422124.1 hypothetical protein [Methylobacterium ajmalii]MBZ6416919.1 head-tail connector protein [Methylobacterium sp.]